MFSLKWIGGVLFNLVFFGALLFLPAGTLDWWRAWVLICGVTVASIASVARVNQELLEERLKPPIQRGQPLADKIIVVLLSATYAGVIVAIPLDVFRYHVLPKPGTVVSSAALVLFAAGWWIVTLALRENAFAVSVVKHQKERHQTVIDSGVYGVVRHPMYAGAALVLLGMPLWLQSSAAAVLALVPMALLVIRIRVEERFLRQELDGYAAYAARIRYRMIPFLW